MMENININVQAGKKNEKSQLLKRIYSRQRFSNLFTENLVWFLLVTVLLGMSIFNPNFLSGTILMNVLVQGTVLGFLAMAMTLPLIIGEIDLSIVGVLGFSAAIGASMMAHNNQSGIEAFIAIIGIGAIIGLFNGWVISRLKVNALIGTLAVNLVLQGAALAFTRGRSIMGFTPGYRWIGQAQLFSGVFEVSVLPIVLILAYIAANFLLKRTEFGRSLYAVGGNSKAAYNSGINVKDVRMMTFVFSGIIAAFAGYLISARMGVVTAKLGQEYLMYAIAAPIIGGVSIFGGIGRIPGVLGGVLLITIIKTGLQIINIPSFWVNFVGGMVILVAALIDAIRHMILTADE